MKKVEAKRRKKQIVGIVLILSVMSVLPGNVMSAPSWRGDARTTYQQWSFSSWNYGPLAPDAPDANGSNPYGDPMLVVSSCSQWNASIGQHTGVWTLAGEMDAIIPNYPEVGGYKEMWIELTWKGAGFSFLPDRPLVGVETDVGYDRMEIDRGDTPGNGGWTTTLYKILIWPNPTSEWIAIKGDIYVDRVTVDTYCSVPEPGTMVLLGLGAILGLKRRRNV